MTELTKAQKAAATKKKNAEAKKAKAAELAASKAVEAQEEYKEEAPVVPKMATKKKVKAEVDIHPNSVYRIKWGLNADREHVIVKMDIFVLPTAKAKALVLRKNNVADGGEFMALADKDKYVKEIK